MHVDIEKRREREGRCSNRNDFFLFFKFSEMLYYSACVPACALERESLTIKSIP